MGIAIWSGVCKLSFRALASRRPARAAPRHEQDTYAPYRDALLQMKVDFKTFFNTDRMASDHRPYYGRLNPKSKHRLFYTHAVRDKQLKPKDGTSGFPQADERQLLFWQDLPKEVPL